MANVTIAEVNVPVTRVTGCPDAASHGMSSQRTIIAFKHVYLFTEELLLVKCVHTDLAGETERHYLITTANGHDSLAYNARTVLDDEQALPDSIADDEDALKWFREETKWFEMTHDSIDGELNQTLSKLASHLIEAAYLTGGVWKTPDSIAYDIADEAAIQVYAAWKGVNTPTLTAIGATARRMLDAANELSFEPHTSVTGVGEDGEPPYEKLIELPGDTEPYWGDDISDRLQQTVNRLATESFDDDLNSLPARWTEAWNRLNS